ncbi:hypothetical protein AC579_10457 [Pseudocercospora musae]|uniref:FAD/NAD(P)-binding domain-containing protein n=1 Tax=Pseudocercospora musae TaxID=113226 RepID=A0A139IDY2_9PEZI|nr:hypothetical protein AC579_10457 [Pseudocercospora musae]
MDEKREFKDVIVVGAGIGGLCAAKTYLELSPGADVTVLESRPTLGGVWAEQNLYEGLCTNNLYGTYEYSDFPMYAEKYGLKKDMHIPGEVMYRYLTDYAKHFDIFRRINFSTKVTEVEKLESGWKITTTANHNDSFKRVYYTHKLIMCNGLASNPNPITIPGHENFDKPIFNHGGLKDKAEALARHPNVKHVTVIGASKIGYDAVWLFAHYGKKVDWIIRKSGGGAVWMSKPYVKIGPWVLMLEHVACTRFFTWFSPCIWGSYDGFGWIRRLLNKTRIGRWLMDGMWENSRNGTIEVAGYRREERLKHLEPTESLFWTARVGIHNYPTDIHDFVRSGQVTVKHKDVDSLSSGGTVNFADRTSQKTDVLVQITGWQLIPTIRWKPEGIDASVGVPSQTYSRGELDFWSDLDKRADSQILGQFPRLANAPKNKLPYTQPVTPFRLYRGIAAPGLTAHGDRSLAFVKMVHCTSNIIVAETQSLWLYAYMNHKLNIDERDVYWQTALSSRFGAWRYPWGFSKWWPEFVYDTIPYADMLLTDLGLRKHRKSSWLKERFEGYTIHDYKGINGEWRAKYGKGKR